MQFEWDILDCYGDHYSLQMWLLDGCYLSSAILFPLYFNAT